MFRQQVGKPVKALLGATAVWMVSTIAAPEAQAQFGLISGQVTDAETGQPIAAAQVMVQGTRLGTLTGSEGRYTLNGVPAGTHTLIVQRIGYREVQRPNVTVTGGQTAVVDLTLSSAALQLDAVVATGLIDPVEGRRSPITVGRVDRELMPVPVAGSAVQNLQGRVAGVTVARRSGEPGTEAEIQLRSPTLIACNTAGCPSGTPLIVVDGVVLGSSSINLESLDIVSIEVVKGAAAASLYGSRANNGVIAITTNRGADLAQGQTQMSYRSEIGWQEPIKGLGLPTHHYWAVDDEENPTTYIDPTTGQPVSRSQRVNETSNQHRLFMDNKYPVPLYDNVNGVWNPGTYQYHTLTLAQNTASTNFFISLNRNVDQGAMPNNKGYSRDAFRINLDHRFLRGVSLSLSGFHSRDYLDDVNGSLTNMYGAPRDVDLKAPPVTPEDSIGGFVKYPIPENTDFQNPLWVEGVVEDERWRVRTLGNAQLRWEPFSSVSFLAGVSYDRQDSKTRNYTPPGILVGNDDDGNLSLAQSLNDTWNAEAQVSLRRDFGPLNTRVTLRGIMERERNESATASGNVLVIRDTPTLEAVPSSNQSSTSSESEVRANGILFDTALDYGGRYIGTFLVRRDGSSLFGAQERWHTYYRVAAKWRLSEEPWFNVPGLTEFSLNFSRGTAGGRPGFSAQYEVWNLSNGTVSKGQLGNRFLKPSHTTEHDASIQAVINGRWEITANYAWQKTEDQIQNVPLLGFFGFPSQWKNGGTIEGSTIELTLNAQVLQSSRFAWSTTVVADRSNSTITEWPFACTSPAWRERCAGRGVYEVWAYRFVDGFNDHFRAHRGGELIGHESEFQVNDDGFLVWVGQGNDYRDGAGPDGILNTDDDLWGTSKTIGSETYFWGIPFQEREPGGGLLRQKIGDGRHTNIGWINNFNFGAFTLHAQLHAKIGGDLQNTQHQYLIPTDNAPMQDQYGKPTGLKKPRSYYTTLYATAGGSTYFNEDGSYLKLRTVALNYRLPPMRLAQLGLSRLGITGLTVGLVGRNLYTWTNYRGWDPEQGLSLSGGAQEGALGQYPPTRSYTAEFQVTF